MNRKIADVKSPLSFLSDAAHIFFKGRNGMTQNSDICIEENKRTGNSTASKACRDPGTSDPKRLLHIKKTRAAARKAVRERRRLAVREGETIGEKIIRAHENGNGALISRAAGFLMPAASFLFSFIVSAASPAMNVYPFGVAALAAASSFAQAVACLAGTLAAALRMGKNASAVYILVCSALFVLRLAAGGLGLVKTKSWRVRNSSAGQAGNVSRAARLSIKEAFSVSSSVKVWFAFGASFAVGIYNIFFGANLWYDVFACVFGIVITPLFALTFSVTGDGATAPQARKAGLWACAYAVFLALSHVAPGGMNLAVILAFFSSMYVGCAFGISDGVLLGLFAGMAQTPAFAVMYPIGAVCCGALSSFSIGASCVTSSILAISWAVYSDGISAFSSVMPEILFAAAVFYPVMSFKILPEKINLFDKKKRELSCEEDFSTKKNGCAFDRIGKISDAMSHMAKIFEGLSERLKLPAFSETVSMCEEAFSLSCIDCGKRHICHVRESFGDGVAVRAVSKVLKEEGRVSVGAFPESMRRGCPEIDRIVKEINAEYRKFLEKSVSCDKTAVMARDYGDIASLIRESLGTADEEWDKNDGQTERLSEALLKNGIVCEAVSVYGKKRLQIFIRGLSVKELAYGTDDIRVICEKATGALFNEPEMSIDYDKLNIYMDCRKRFTLKLGKFSDRASYPEVNGDVISSFSSESGEECTLICDGMGSGREAALTARISSVFLERMLGAGCPAELALRLLNNFTRERRIECFSTVDLMKIDAYSGRATFIKSGAAPSFVLRRGKIFKIEADTAPIGILKDVSAKATSFDLREGDVVVMMSDGILPDDENCGWLYDYLSGQGERTGEPGESAKKIVELAKKHCRRPDDATAGVIRIYSA